MKIDVPLSAQKLRMNHALFAGHTKIADLLMANGRLLYVLPCFGIEMGFGEKTIEEVCDEYEVSLPLFLVVCNQQTFDNYSPNNAELRAIDINDVVEYLQSSHKWYIETDMPEMINNLLALAEQYVRPETRNMLTTFCEKYRQEVIAHIRYEEEFVFPYIRQLLAGGKPDNRMSEYQNSHQSVDTALRDLRNLIVKYVPGTCSVRECLPMLVHIRMFEYTLMGHTRLEDTVLIPLMELLQLHENNDSYAGELSDRERQTLAALARGLSNKEIADALNISRHTVVSHRKNIVRKTGLKTAQGLTLYAFIHKLISLKDLR